jgi:hypothetical protein
MRTKEQQDASDVKVDYVGICSVHYSISESCGDYEFTAIVADFDSADGIDENGITMLRIDRKSDDNDGFQEPVFDYAAGWDIASEDERDVKAYRQIQAFLEDLPVNKPESMKKLYGVQPVLT